MTGNYFCVLHKSRRKHNQHFKLNSHFIKSNSTPAFTKLDLLLINSICLIVSSLEMQRKLILTKVHYKFLSSVSKETTHKPSKVVVAKNFSSGVHVINTKLLRRMLFIPFDNWKSVLFVIVFCSFEIISAAVL